MLTQLSVRNLVIVDQLTIDFEPGMTVLTGETGAGKSILVDALSLALGGRGSAGLVRAGAPRAEVDAVFRIDDMTPIAVRLRELELESHDEELHLRRTVSTDGRSRAYVNARPVPAQVLRELGEQLVDVHGQHEHQSLLRADTQRDLVDAHGDLTGERDAVRSAYARWRTLDDERESLLAGHGDHAARLALLNYQVEELNELAAEPDEYTALLEEFRQIASAEDVKRGCGLVRDLLCDAVEANAVQLLERARTELYGLNDPELEAAIQLLDSAAIEATEAAALVAALAERRDVDPVRLRAVEARLQAFQDLARKHRVAPGEVGELCASLQAELAAADAKSERIATIDADLAASDAAYRDAASALSSARAKTAGDMASAISASLGDLGMREARCEILVTPVRGADAREAARPRVDGLDHVEFVVAMNPGAPPGPLARAASGGELSRLSLAIQVQLARGSGVPTLVFDEVDVGIGGSIAEIVGRKLRTVATHRQVLCITHLPQVAVQGAQHLGVRKIATTDETTTAIAPLSTHQRVEEVARMLGGQTITARTEEHAREMLDLANAEPALTRRQRVAARAPARARRQG